MIPSFQNHGQEYSKIGENSSVKIQPRGYAKRCTDEVAAAWSRASSH